MNAQKIAKIAVNDPTWVRYTLTGLTLLVISLFLILPLVTIFSFLDTLLFHGQ